MVGVRVVIAQGEEETHPLRAVAVGQGGRGDLLHCQGQRHQIDGGVSDRAHPITTRGGREGGGQGSHQSGGKFIAWGTAKENVVEAA